MSEKDAKDDHHDCVKCPCDPKTHAELFGTCICGMCGHLDDGEGAGGFCSRCGADNWIQRADLCDPKLHDYVWHALEAMSKRIGTLDPANKIIIRLRNKMLEEGISEEELIDALDEEVHEAKNEEASRINNEGLDAQIELVGIEAAKKALKNLTREKAHRGAPGDKS